MKSILSSVLFGLFAAALPLSGAWAQDSQVQLMGDRFVSSLPADWSALKGGWTYFDVVDCYTHGETCFGNNPSSPYGYPTFPGGAGTDSLYYNLNPSDAVVIFLRTPPQVRYFGFTQYLMNRGGSQTPIFGSLSDTLNHLKFVNLGDAGSGAFNQYAVLVWTADLTTLESVKAKLALQGIRPEQVNFLPIPYQLPVYMGSGPTADTFAMLMRTALASVQADFESYKNEKPFYVLKVGPQNSSNLSPAPIVGYADEKSGVTEDAAQATALAALVNDIKAKYQRSFNLRSQLVTYSQKVGWDCINGFSSCAGDNHDALYSADLTRPLKVSSLSDIVIVAGVNHQKTGKALYLNHAVYDTVKMAGIVSVDDRSFTSKSAYYHAGVYLPNDPRRVQYANLYAYVISYSCGSMSYCLPIPAPTPENPVGLEPGAPFYVVGRSYVDPHTGVRPSEQEVVQHQVLVGTKR